MPGKPRCRSCGDTGHVCENHPDRPWGGLTSEPGSCECGAGMPCPACCSPIPQDGTVPIGWAFVPDWKRGELNAALAARR
jgi:hypothetical protein